MKPFLLESDFLDLESQCALLSCINHNSYFRKPKQDAMDRSKRWLSYFDLPPPKNNVEYDMIVPILEGDDEIIRRDVNRTFASDKYRDILHIVLYKCKKKFGDYQQSLSYMGGFLLLFYDMGTTYKILTILNSDPFYLCNYWRSEQVQCCIDGWVLFDLLPAYLPRLSEMFVQNGIQPNIIALSQKWFGGVFIQNVPCPYLLDIMSGLFQHGVKYIYRISLSLLKELEPLLLEDPALYKMQAVVRLLNKGTKRVEQKHLICALQTCNEDRTLDGLLQFDLQEMRHRAFRTHLQGQLTAANYNEMQMPVELEAMSDEEEEMVEDGVLAIQKCIQEKRLKKELLVQILDQVKVELGLVTSFNNISFLGSAGKRGGQKRSI